jgi:hypothetical protein
MKEIVGSLAWASKTRGTLSGAEKRRILAEALKFQLRKYTADAKKAMGFGKELENKAIWREIAIPDSLIAKASEELCIAVSSKGLVNHGYRAYAWGALLAARNGVKYDPEILYVASILHDIGLTPAYWGKNSGCFAIEGAEAALEFLLEKGWEKRKAEIAADAIALHLNVSVTPEHGEEAHLMNAGVAFDVIGFRYDQIEKEAIGKVIKKYPRHDFKKEICGLLKEQAEMRPDSRIGLLINKIGFIGRVKASPFSE